MSAATMVGRIRAAVADPHRDTRGVCVVILADDGTASIPRGIGPLATVDDLADYCAAWNLPTAGATFGRAVLMTRRDAARMGAA